MGGRLLIFGLGHAGAAVARAALAAGMRVRATSRTPGVVRAPPGIELVPFATASLSGVTHVLATVPPGDVPPGGTDPVLAAHGAALADCATLRWAGYLSSTGVYGDRRGGRVDETSAIAPASARSRRRAAAERGWAALAGTAVDIFRVAGIYGPDRSALDQVRGGRAIRIIRPGHVVSRIHRDDIAGAVLAAMRAPPPPGTGARVLHLADDLPAEPAEVLAEAAWLLGAPLPPAIPFHEAPLSPMAAGFWAERRRVASTLTQRVLGYRWRHPDYRAGLRAILAEQRRDGAGEQGEIGRA
jgi:nucleoside-diphosphate-sugar epimerase